MSEPKMLPALPKPALTFDRNGSEGVFTADQVRSIQLATLEFAASLCDARAMGSRYYREKTEAEGCAAAIRNAGEPQP